MYFGLKNREEAPRFFEMDEDFVEDGDITAQWVWERLQAAFPQVQAPWFETIEWDFLDGGLNSDVIRIKLISSKKFPSGLPSSVVKKRVFPWEEVMGSPPIFGDSYAWMAKNEIRYYQEVAPITGVQFPKVYWSTPLDSKGPFDIIVEDLGKQAHSKAPYWLIDKAKSAIVSLAKIHSATWAPKHLEMGWTKRFICQNTAPALLEFCRPVWEDFTTNLFTPKHVRLTAGFVLENPRVLDLLISRPSTLRFYDLRQSNILKNQNDEFILVDPALASLGLGVTDILHIIRDTYTTGSREELSKELLNYYYDNLSPEVRQSYSLDDLSMDRDFSIVESLLARTLILSMLNPQDRPDVEQPRKFLYPLQLAHFGVSQFASAVIRPFLDVKNSQWNWKMLSFTRGFSNYELRRVMESIRQLKKLL